MDIKGFVRSHQISSYFVLTFTLSWLSALLLAAPNLLRGEAVTADTGIIMFPVMIIWPSLVSIALTAIVEGRQGLRELRSRMGNWRVGAQWYAVALLTPPVLITLVLFALSALVSPVFAPHIFAWGFLFGIPAGLFEEVGWTGFVYPRMSLKYGALPAALMLGLVWGIWHLPVVDFLGTASPHGGYLIPFFLSFVLVMSAIRVLIAWVYTNTRSILLAQVLHASSTGCLVMFSPAALAAGQEAFWYAVYGAVLWMVVAAVAMTYGKRLTRRSLQATAA